MHARRQSKRRGRGRGLDSRRRTRVRARPTGTRQRSRVRHKQPRARHRHGGGGLLPVRLGSKDGVNTYMPVPCTGFGDGDGDKGRAYRYTLDTVEYTLHAKADNADKEAYALLLFALIADGCLHRKSDSNINDSHEIFLIRDQGTDPGGGRLSLGVCSPNDPPTRPIESLPATADLTVLDWPPAAPGSASNSIASIAGTVVTVRAVLDVLNDPTVNSADVTTAKERALAKEIRNTLPGSGRGRSARIFALSDGASPVAASTTVVSQASSSDPLWPSESVRTTPPLHQLHEKQAVFEIQQTEFNRRLGELERRLQRCCPSSSAGSSRTRGTTEV